MDCSGVETRRGREIGSLFWTFLKIGAFTFGGGYGMLRLLEDVCVEKKGWLTREEFLGMVAMAESTPGPVAINSATYIGYKRAGILGSAVATAAVCLPSFVLLYLISLFFDRFLDYAIVEKAFRGIQCCVVYLILSAGVKMAKGIWRHKLHLVLCVAVLCVMTALTVLSVSFSSIYYILLCGLIGIAVNGIRARGNARARGKRGER